jgi:Na+-transporting NADH:ubiquinone oxidoreductase subunit C
MNDRQKQIQVVVFTLAVTAFFGLLVTGLEALLADKRTMNEKVARQKVILQLFGLKSGSEEWPGEMVINRFAEQVEMVATKSARGADFTYYRLKDAKTGRLFVAPFRGKGFWDTISGFYSVDAASDTLKNIEFLIHSETPGLGGRISEAAFKARFVGLPLRHPDETGHRFYFVPEGTARKELPQEIDGLTGASETTRAVERLLNEALAEFLALIDKEAKP